MPKIPQHNEVFRKRQSEIKNEDHKNKFILDNHKRRLLESNFVVVEVKGQLLGLLKSFKINFVVNHAPIKVWGESVVYDWSIQHTHIEMSGDLYYDSSEPLVYAGVVPKTPFKMIAQSLGKFTFDVVVYEKKMAYSGDSKSGMDNMLDNLLDNKSSRDKPASATAEGFKKGPILFKIERCRFNGAHINIDANKPVSYDFKLIGSVGEIVTNYEDGYNETKEHVTSIF